MDNLPPDDARLAFPPSTGLALASLLLGVAAVGLSFLLVGFLAGLVGLVLGWVYLNKKRGPTTMARWGIVLCVLGMLATIGWGALYYSALQKLKGNFPGGFGAIPTGALSNPASLPPAATMLKSNLAWSASIPGAQALCVGDWESDGSARVLVAAGTTLRVFDLTGMEKSSFQLPGQYSSLECGRNKTSGARLLCYSQFQPQLVVVGHDGKVLWRQSAGMGLDGAHWGDLSGDGNDALIMGMNGFSGLKAISSDGKELWSASLGNVWSQAIIPAAANRPALVLATDAGGSVNLFDAAGKRTNSLRPEGGYYTQMTAGLVESNNVQILAFSQNAVVAFDQKGKTNWISPAEAMTGATRQCAALGSVTGDGAKQWAFIDAGGDLVIATPGGQKLASMAIQGGISGFAFAPRQGQGDLLITLDAGVVRAYSFAP